jgi:WD40 repeat protein
MKFTPDGGALAVGYYPSIFAGPEETSVSLRDPRTGRELRRFAVGRDEAEDFAFTPDGSRLAAGAHNRVWAWDVPSGKLLGPDLSGHLGDVLRAEFTADGRLATAADDYTVRLWDPATGRQTFVWPHDYWVRDLAVSPDGGLVAGSSLRDDLRVWDARTGALRYKLPGNGEVGGDRRVAFTPDGARLLAWGDDMFVRVWDVRTGRLLAENRVNPTGVEVPAPDAPPKDRLLEIGPAAFTPDGTRLVLCFVNTVHAFDPATGRELFHYQAGATHIRAIDVSPDGRRLLVGNLGNPVENKLPDGTVRHSAAKSHAVTVYELESGLAITQVECQGYAATSVRFTPDGKRFAALSGDNRESVRFWDPQTGKVLGQVGGLPERGWVIAFDRAGRRMFVGMSDGTGLLYDLASAVKPVAKE